MISPKHSPHFMRRSTTPIIISPHPIPPPLPPRRSSPTMEQIVIPSTSFTQSIPKIHLLNDNTLLNNICQTSSSNGGGMNEAQSVTNLSSQNKIDIPQISKSNSMHDIHNVSNDDNEIELSTPETIYGWVISNINGKIQNRHLSCPNTKIDESTVQIPIKSNTISNLNNTSSTIDDDDDGDGHKFNRSQHIYENIDLKAQKLNPLLLNKNNSVCYENLNMDYIKKLVNEGYSQDAVIKALGITRNNVDMACDILHEFGTKHG